MDVLLVSVTKLGCMQYECDMNENILNVALFPLYVVSMEFIIVSVIKLGCMCSL